MIKKLSASLFILLLAGQVWAGVCGCVTDAKGGMSCCKRSKSERSVRGKSCCGDSCKLNSQSNPPRSQSAQESFSAQAETAVFAPFRVPGLGRRDGDRLENQKAERDISHALFARPPNLFIVNHSFRI